MKKIKIAMAVIIINTGLFIACQKEDSNSATTSTRMVADKSQVKPGESVSFAILNGTQGGVAKWTVQPNTNLNLSRSFSWDQKNTITFNQEGTYSVTAEIKKVWCDSAAAANPGMDTCLNSGTTTAKTTATVIVKN